MLNEQECHKFFHLVVIPFCKSSANTGQMHVVVDSQNNLIHASKQYLQKINYVTENHIAGQKIEDVHKIKERYPHLYKQYQQINNAVLKEKKEMHYLFALELADGLNINLVQQTPLYHNNGNIIGVLTTINDVIATCSPHNHVLYKLSKRQAEIAFLLILGASQKEVAQIFNISRGTVSSSIDQICIKLGLSGSSEKLVIKRALELDIWRIPLELINPCLVPVHQLYSNAHIIKHLFKM